MKRHAPEVRSYMTHLPIETERCETAEQALEIMDEHQIHHIPVMNGSHLCGVVTRSGLLEAKLNLGNRFAAAEIETLCVASPLIVKPVEAIDEVARKMREINTDYALVMDGGFVVGVFTTTDVLKFVTEFFGQ